MQNSLDHMLLQGLLIKSLWMRLHYDMVKLQTFMMEKLDYFMMMRNTVRTDNTAAIITYLLFPLHLSLLLLLLLNRHLNIIALV